MNLKSITESPLGISLLSIIPAISMYVGWVKELFISFKDMDLSAHIPFISSLSLFVVIFSFLWIRKSILEYIRSINERFDSLVPNIKIKEAWYGDANVIDVAPIIKELIENGQYRFKITSQLFKCYGQENDPAWGVIKTLKIRYTLGNKEKTLTGKDNQDVVLY